MRIRERWNDGMLIEREGLIRMGKVVLIKKGVKFRCGGGMFVNKGCKLILKGYKIMMELRTDSFDI